MADYRLDGLNPRDFEHLSQALSLNVFGSGVTPFGDGRDGGREATFNGTVQGSTPQTTWNGYGVIQCKFRQRPTDDIEEDSIWAVKQLRQDLEKFLDPKRKLPKPDYYVFISNVRLSSVAEAGGKDRILKILREYQPKIGLKDFDVWDYDKLCRLLDNNSDVRNAYAAFITMGDVIEAMRQKLTEQSPDFWQIISRYLQEEFHSELWARLEHAGQASEHRVALANVFVDLPFGPTAQNDIAAEHPSRLRSGVVATLMSFGDQRLKPSLRQTSAQIQAKTENSRSRIFAGDRLLSAASPGRFVLVGGPGQGKSTVGQFICQLFRASFLVDLPTHTLTPECSEGLKVFHLQCQATDVKLPMLRRFPVRIELDNFATQLSKGETTSLLDAIRQRINLLADSNCNKDDLRRWLANYPWLIVLDGLDEVPISSNRDEVMKAIHQFFTEIHAVDADVFVIATTRPQGYEGEFAPEHYEHFHLLPLSPTRAINYGERLALARYRNEKANYEMVTSRLKMAAEQPATARLMRSPLQVTIMATLVLSGQPPQERWNLFERYFEAVYSREIARNIPTSRILRERRSDVEAIHQWCGLRLQRDGETAGKTEALLSTASLAELINTYSSEEGCAEEEIAQRTNEILQATTDRLVFLAPLQQDSVGFEIRSLQEFMAADALMDGADEDVERRLEIIAVAPYWRNVFLFAAGKCFADQRSRRAMIVSLCSRLNLPAEDQDESVLHSPLAAATLVGSRLALDILEEEVARDKFRIQLIDIALQLLKSPDEDANARLTSLYDPKLEELFKEKIEAQLNQSDFETRIGAWVVLKILCARNTDWACEISNQYWPSNPKEALRIFELYGSRIPVTWASTKLSAIVLANEPNRIIQMMQPNEVREGINRSGQPCGALANRSDLAPWLSALLHSSQHNLPDSSKCRASALFDEDGESRYDLEIISLRSLPEWVKHWRHFPDAVPLWAAYRACGEFFENPSPENLAIQLRVIACHWDRGYVRDRFPRRLAPWPLLACVYWASSSEDLIDLAIKSEQGKLGSWADWIAAEDRWVVKGYTQEDHVWMTSKRWPFDESIAERGFPLAAASEVTTNSDTKLHWPFFLEKWETAPQGHARAYWAQQTADFLRSRSWFSVDKVVSPIVDLAPQDAKRLFNDAQEEGRSLWFALDSLSAFIPTQLSVEWLSFLDWLSKCKLSYQLSPMKWSGSKHLAHHFANNPQNTGLLRLLGCLAVCGNDAPVNTDLLAVEIFEALEKEEKYSAKYGSYWIRLRQAQLTEVDEIQSLACECADLDALKLEASDDPVSDGHVIDLSLMLLRHRELTPCQEERFLLALRQRSRQKHYGQEYKIIDSLNRLLSRRQSHLDQPDIWQSLGLPKI